MTEKYCDRKKLLDSYCYRQETLGTFGKEGYGVRLGIFRFGVIYKKVGVFQMHAQCRAKNA